MGSMLKRLFLLLATVATGALVYVAWTRREELQRMGERAAGEWRSATATAGAGGSAAHGGRPRVNGPQPGEPGARVGTAASTPSPRCAATTRSGERCTRVAEPGSDVCWQHAGS